MVEGSTIVTNHCGERETLQNELQDLWGGNMGVNLAAMAVGARLFCQTTASLWQLPLPFLPAVTLKIILPGTLGEQSGVSGGR